MGLHCTASHLKTTKISIRYCCSLMLLLGLFPPAKISPVDSFHSLAQAFGPLSLSPEFLLTTVSPPLYYAEESNSVFNPTSTLHNPNHPEVHQKFSVTKCYKQFMLRPMLTGQCLIGPQKNNISTFNSPKTISFKFSLFSLLQLSSSPYIISYSFKNQRLLKA